MKKIVSIISVLSVMMAGCLKDKAVVDFSTISPVVELPYHGLEGFSGDAVLTAGQTDPIVVPIIVNLASVNPLSKDINITLAVDDAIRTQYNGTGGVQYEQLPDSTYTFAEKTGVIKAGSRLDTLYVTVFPEKVDPTINYMLPVKIADASGTTISGNFGIAYLHMIGNPLAGPFQWAWTRFNASDTTGAPNGASFTFADGVTATFLPDNPTTIEVQSGYGDQNGLNIRYVLSFTNTGGVLSDFHVKINPSDVTNSITGAIGALSFTDATILTADGVNKHFRFTYAVVNSAGAPRVFIDDFMP
jgi:Domain of unknown function (DUF1735)